MKLKFSELDAVKLLKNYPNEGLCIGDVGAIIMVYTSPNEAYEVEFVDSDGKTKTQVTLLPHELVKA